MVIFKVLSITLVIVILITIAIEIGLRLLFGFGNPLIYIPDKQIGYLLAPNQQVRRMGNKIEINEYSMRSKSLKKNISASTLRVLLLGDSIANGGWWTNQDKTISSLIKTQLESVIKELKSYSSIEVFNASANSWGPRNQIAYLQRFGLFDAKILLLLINTDDLFAIAPTSIQVGRDRNYPDRKPLLATVELLSQLVKKEIPEMAELNAEAGDRVGFNLEAIAQIQTIAAQKGALFILAMTPLLREIREPGSRDYEIKARSRLQQFTSDRNIIYIDFLELFSNFNLPLSPYRDNIHLNFEGNRIVSEKLTEVILNLVIN